MADGINSPGQAADNHRPLFGQLPGDVLRHLLPVAGVLPGAHHPDGQAAIQPRQAPPEVQRRRAAVNLPQTLGVALVIGGEDVKAQAMAPLQDFLGLFLAAVPLEALHLAGFQEAAGGQGVPGHFKEGAGVPQAGQEVLAPGASAAKGLLKANPRYCIFHWYPSFSCLP